MPQQDTMPPDAVRTAFIEKVGLITQAEGLPRIAGRVFGTLLFDGEAVSFGDLAADLRVSRGSISTSVRLLEDRGLIKRVTRPGARQDFFQLAANPYATMLQGTQDRTRRARAEIVDTLDALPAGSDAARRLTTYARFFTTIDAALDTALADLRDADGAPAAPATAPEGHSTDDT